MNCLWCQEEILLDIDWTSLIVPKQPNSLCESCEQELDKITGSRCQKCSRISSERICTDCKFWSQYMKGEDPLQFNYSIFRYNTWMQKVITRWKYRGDYELGKAFQKSFLENYYQQFKEFDHMIAVPIPLSKQRIQHRRFNQARMLAEFLPIPVCDMLKREDGEKQSKKSRYQRIATENPFKITKKIKHKVILLVDDIYTTGSTIRHAASLLKAHGCEEIFSYTLIRG